MRTLEQIKGDVKRLSKDDQEALLDWLTNILEDDLELTDEFKAKIEQAKLTLRMAALELFIPNSVNYICHD
jgi:formate dehydrogenase maturation protein FdhE